MYHAFIDEAGDDGMADKGPPWLLLSAVVYNEPEIPAIKLAFETELALIWQGKQIPAQVHFHKQTHGRKKALLRVINKLADTAITVAMDKRRLTQEQKQRLICPKAYHYLAKHLMERLSWFGRDNNQPVALHFSERKQIHAHGLKTYLLHTLRHEFKKTHDTDYRFIHSCGVIAAPANRLVQSSDWMASGISLGLNPDPYDQTSPEYCQVVWRKFWVRKGNLWSYGFKCLPTNYDRGECSLLKEIGTWLEVPTASR